MTMFVQPCDNLATNLATVLKYKVVPRLCQGCDKVVKKHCGNLVPRLCQGCDNLVISVWVDTKRPVASLGIRYMPSLSVVLSSFMGAWSVICKH